MNLDRRIPLRDPQPPARTSSTARLVLGILLIEAVIIVSLYQVSRLVDAVKEAESKYAQREARP